MGVSGNDGLTQNAAGFARVGAQQQMAKVKKKVTKAKPAKPAAKSEKKAVVKTKKSAAPTKDSKAAAPSKKVAEKAKKPEAAAKKTSAAKTASKPSKSAKSAKASKPEKGKGAASAAQGGDAKKDASPPLKRKLGLRGAAPWAARHAAKHAAEARARAAEPAPPGSARATIRTPSGAEEIKAKIAELHNQTQKIRTLRRRFDKSFFEIGQVLLEIQQQELYQAKGFGSFESFLERETDLGKQTALKLIKVAQVFQQEAALDYGVDRCLSALSALEGEIIASAAPKTAPSAPSTPGSKPPMLPLKPPTRNMM